MPSKLNDPTNVPAEPATVRATDNPVPNPGLPNSHFTAVLVIHDCLAQIEDCIRTETVRSAVTKLTPAMVIAVDAVTAALGLSKPLNTGAEIECFVNGNINVISMCQR